MPRRTRPDLNPVRAAAVTAAKGASWMSLIAATSLGMGPIGAYRATVSAREPLVTDESSDMRLIVQSYRRASLTDDLRPRLDARPRASLQRAVTTEELAAGVSVSMVDLEQDDEDCVVVAWLERGAPTLEYDALTARPGEDAYVGVGVDEAGEGARIVLRRG